MNIGRDACTVRSEPARIERNGALVTTSFAPKVYESLCRVAAGQKGLKRLTNEAG